MPGSAPAGARRGLPRPQARLLATIVAGICTVCSIYAACCERARCRRLLAQMSPRELADIGINRSEICADVEKPFWHG